MVKKKLAGALQNAVTRSVDLGARFDNAEQVLQRQPTGFATPIPFKDVGTPGAHPAVPTAAKPLDDNAKAELNELISRLDVSRYGVPRYEEWPVELIDDNPYNARSIYEPQKIAEMSRQLASDGQLVPGIAVARGSRRTLVAAHYRKRGLIMAGIPVMRLMVYDDMSDEDLYALSYKENTQRNDQTALDNAIAWRKLLDNSVFPTQEALAVKIGVSRPTVVKTLSLLDLPKEVLQQVEETPSAYSFRVLYELTQLQKVMPEEELIQVALEVPSRNTTAAELVAMRESVQAKKEKQDKEDSPRRTNNTARQYRIYGPKGKIGYIKEWDSGKVTFEMQFADPAEQAALVAELRDRYQNAGQPGHSAGGAVDLHETGAA